MVLVAITLMFYACTGTDDVVVLGPSCTAIGVTSDIVTPTIWTTGNVYVLRSDIKVQSTLTIQPGAIIKLDDARLETINQGRIIAEGTAANRIIFTSLADDSCCGDTNGDGNATIPQKGDWVSIYLNGGSNHVFKYCDFLYAGQNKGGYHNAVTISVAGASFSFDHCVFAHTFSAGSTNDYAFYGGQYMTNPVISVFTSNAFYNNDRPLYIDCNYTLATTNIFHNPLAVTEKNKRNGIFLSNTAKDNWETNWWITEVPYVLTGFNQGGLQNELYIWADVVVKFDGPTSGLLFQATRPVNLSARAVLTSYKDDTLGGDTNGDGNATMPAFGDWDGFFNSDPNVYVSAANILYDNH